jgi:hypothetical protein
VVLAATGCAVWKTQQAPAVNLLAGRQPKAVRVWLSDEKHPVVVSFPSVEGDSLVGWRVEFNTTEPRNVAEARSRPRVAFALSRVRRIQTVGVSVLGTAAVLTCLAGLGLVVWYYLALSAHPEESSP